MPNWLRDSAIAQGNLALFATSLSFTHPVTKERLCFKVEPPKELSPWKIFDTSSALKMTY